jgi:hypothetical protein
MLVTALLLLTSTVCAGSDPGGPEPKGGPGAPAPAAAGEARVNLFLGGPPALDALLKSIQQPDFVLLKGDEFRKLLQRAGEPAAAAGEPAAVVTSVAVDGTIGAESAELTVEYGIVLRSERPTLVPIRLDEQSVTSAREAKRELYLEANEGGWQVELKGAGSHKVRVALKVPLRASVEGHRLELAIPEAASTRFSWEVADRVTEAFTGNGELVEVEALPGSGPSNNSSRTRLSAQLTPRGRLDVSWRIEADPEVQLPPLLTMQGDIAIDVDPGSLRTRSAWAIHSLRGTTRSLELRLDPADEVLELELDGQPVPAGIERSDGATVLAIVLSEPIRPGLPKSLVMTTRRAIATGMPFLFAGFTLNNAREQSGAIGIAQSGDLWVGGTPGRGLRRIDPRTELTPELRARPATTLAFAFADQPFDLSLRVDRSPPLVRTEARTTVALDARQARVDTWLAYQPAHGRLFDVAIGLPEGLELESVGPREVVEASQRERDSAGSAPHPQAQVQAGAGRVVTCRLTPQAQEGGEFTLHLTGRQPLDPARPVNLGLFQPLDATSGGGRIAVLTGRNVTVDLPGAGAATATGGFRPAVGEPPGDWPWPADRDRTAGSLPALWLRHDGRPAELPLAITVHPRALSYRTSLSVQVERRWISVEQETECSVHFGTLSSLEVEVPSLLRGRWETEGSEVVRWSVLGNSPAGDLRVRLELGKEATDKVRLRFRSRRPFAAGPGPGSGSGSESEKPVAVEVPWIRPTEGDALPLPLQVQVGAEPGIELEVSGGGWTHTQMDDAANANANAAGNGSDQPVRFMVVSDRAEAGPLTLTVLTRPLAALPPLVASRLWLRTTQGPESDLRTTAVYLVDTHASSLAVALPPGSVWERAKVGGITVSRVEELRKGQEYRLIFPEKLDSGPLVVVLEYTTRPALSVSASANGSASGGAWVAPRLLDGGLVQQTLWEIRIPWSHAVVGVPTGWTDENTWVWAGYFFRRRPLQAAAALVRWASGPTEAAPELEGLGLDEAAPADEQSYLFSRPGPPADLPIQIASRGWLVGVCSGSVLAVGAFLILAWRPSRRLAWVAAPGLALALACATLIAPSVTFLAVQAAMIGVGLTLLTALMHWLVHRRGRGLAFGEPSGLARAGAAAPGSSLNRALGVGSDDSTQIRVRPISSTLDRHATPPVVPMTSDQDEERER